MVKPCLQGTCPLVLLQAPGFFNGVNLFKQLQLSCNMPC